MALPIEFSLPVRPMTADFLREPSLHPENPRRRAVRRPFHPPSPMAALRMLFVAGLACGGPAMAAPKIVLISLDGATPRFVERYLEQGVLAPGRGLDLLRQVGVTAPRNVTALPSLTAPSHIAIATGSPAARNDINANRLHLVAAPFETTTSGFAAPIGGYDADHPGPSASPGATPVWQTLRAAGKKVVTATFPGADGADIRLPGHADGPIIQRADVRTADYTVPYGEPAGVRARGFSLSAPDFAPASARTIQALAATGRASFSPVLESKSPIETVRVGGAQYRIAVAALDGSDDGRTNYDTLVFFDLDAGIRPGPFALPGTGPAYVKAADGRSSRFYFEGSASKAGTAFFVTRLAPDLSVVRFARYALAHLPRHPATLDFADDINIHVGFWAPQPDYRIIDRAAPGFERFPDIELEALYLDQVETFVDFQTRVAMRAIARNPDADLVMTYIEQPDGASHQFLLTDPRQASDRRDPASIGRGQDPQKVARYRGYVEKAYRVANEAVHRIIEAVGLRADGRPAGNVLVVSDHGFDTFHTAVSINQLLKEAGIPSSKVRAVTSGPAVNLYINLAGREPDGIVTPDEYRALQTKLVDLLRGLADTNPTYASGAGAVPVVSILHARPVPAGAGDPPLGRATDEFIGQDTGDVFAVLAPGYNFEGTQSPAVRRLGDAAGAAPVFSVPGFYGTHGYDPSLASMSAIFFAAGPDIGQGIVHDVRNIDIAPTIAQLLGVRPASTVQGRGIASQLKEARREEPSGSGPR